MTPTNDKLMREQIASWMGYSSLEEKEEDNARLFRLMENRLKDLSNKESDNAK